MSMTNILVIGVGPHARRIYLPILMDATLSSEVSIVGIVDIDSQKHVVQTEIHNKYPQIEHSIYLNSFDAVIRSNTLTQSASTKLTDFVQNNNIHAVVISSEPSTHIAYAKWALSNGLHILMDKPISAPDQLATKQKAVNQITSDYREIADAYRSKKILKPELRFNVMAQRRYHPAFELIRQKVTEVAERTGSPVTSFQSLHSDGQWRMPFEIVDQDYHPYNRGYGKCLHSGYHGIDITNWIVNSSYVGNRIPTDISTYSNFIYPNDLLSQLPLSEYGKLFSDFDKQNKYSQDELNTIFESYGEVDAQISLDYKNNKNSLTVGQLSLQHNGFGQRNWSSATGRDLYKGNGRVRHEKHYFSQGPFQAIYYESLQSEEILNDSVNHSKTGGEYHLDIHIFRNNKLFEDWKSYEKITLDDLSVKVLSGYSRGHQEDARRDAILDFIKSMHDPKHISRSDLLDHEVSTSIISAVYQSALNKKSRENPMINIDLKKVSKMACVTKEFTHETTS